MRTQKVTQPYLDAVEMPMHEVLQLLLNEEFRVLSGNELESSTQNGECALRFSAM
jgi:hypothetical protein